MEFGEVSGTIAGSSASVEVDGWTFAAKGSLPVNEQFSVFGKFGMINWDAKGRRAASGFSDDGTDLMYGLGAQYMFTDTFGIVGEWEWYDIDSDVDVFSIGALFKF